MTRDEQLQIVALIKREVIPAIGCTEPIAVALCVAKAAETLGVRPEKITVKLSANVLKNAMGVGIPGTGGMIGLPIAVALGALVGRSDYELEVLRDVTAQDVEAGRRMIADKQIDIVLKEGTVEVLYIEAVCVSGADSATAIIAGKHTRFVSVTKNGQILFEQAREQSSGSDTAAPKLSMRAVYDFAMQTPLDDLRFMLDSARLNSRAADLSLQGDYGHGLGRSLSSAAQYAMVGDNVFTSILSYTSAACDARMAGAMIPVMSNSGSGNQGIAATLPVSVYAERNGSSEEALIRALTLSHLTVIYIKQSLGRLSALCGCVVAATGSSCGIVHLMGGAYEQVVFAVKNMIANLTGMICDGAKPSCSMKLTSGVSTAFLSAMLAMEQKTVSSVEGIIDDDVDRSIHNLTRIGLEGMQQADRIILDIMTHKG